MKAIIRDGVVERVVEDTDRYDLTDATVVDAPADYEARPYIWAGEDWAIDLTVCRARRWAEVKARRDQAEWGGCATPLGAVDTDPDSQRKISGAVQMAMIAQAAGEPFALDWTMRDNSVVAHDGAAMVTMGVLVGLHVAACHAAATTLRAAIAVATDEAAIASVDVDAGWPAPV